MKRNRLKEFLPYLTAVLIIFFITNKTFDLKKWKNDTAVIYSDIICYYAYLPATFIFHDYTLNFTDTYKGPLQYLIYDKEKTPQGKHIIKTTMGLAILYSPSFFISDWYAKTHGYNAGGYSLPYKFGLLMNNIFFLCIGFFFLAKLLLKFFSPVISSLAMLIVFFGTNLYMYSIFEPNLSHSYDFTLIVLFIYFSIKWLEKPSIGTSVLLGILIGFISLIRPTNLVIVLFIVLYNVKNLQDLKNRFILFFQKWQVIALMIVLCFVVWVPQLLYWKSITGSYLYFSYGRESFFFGHPHIIKGLFSYRKGWFLYTPIMLVAVLSIPLLLKKYKEFFWPVLIITLLNIYIIFSWWCWWYGGGFSARAMVDFYGLYIFPLGALLTVMADWKNLWLKIGLTSIIVIFFCAGIFFNHKYVHGSIHYDSMTKKALWGSFFHAYPKGDFYNLLEKPDYLKALEGIDAVVDKNQ